MFFTFKGNGVRSNYVVTNVITFSKQGEKKNKENSLALFIMKQ